MENKLYIVPTPIGNLKDITIRSLEVLENSDIIYCEDTRNTIKLLNHYDIKTELKSYHEHNEKSRVSEMIDELNKGFNLAVVSDAGMPGISDPGHVIIKELIKNNLPFDVLPGATATITALVSSGLNTDRFVFLGFYPRNNSEAKEFMKKLEAIDMTAIIYESVHRVKNTLKTFSNKFPNRNIVVTREITKMYEERIRGTCEEVYEIFKNKDNIKGEFVLILDKAEIEEFEIDIKSELLKEIQSGSSKKDAVKNVVKKYDLNKNDVYKVSLEI